MDVIISLKNRNLGDGDPKIRMKKVEANKPFSKAPTVAPAAIPSAAPAAPPITVPAGMASGPRRELAVAPNPAPIPVVIGAISWMAESRYRSFGIGIGNERVMEMEVSSNKKMEESNDDDDDDDFIFQCVFLFFFFLFLCCFLLQRAKTYLRYYLRYYR